MPRTKVSKNSKRNRDAALREEKIRDYETSLDGYLNAMEMEVNEFVTKLDNDLSTLIQRTNSELLQMKFNEFLELNLSKFADWQPEIIAVELNNVSSNAGKSQLWQSMSSQALRCSTKVSNPNDEGYLTEDSAASSCISSGSASASAFISSAMMRPSQHQQQQPQRGRTPGPLNSNRAYRTRRSRSASGIKPPGSAMKSKPYVATVTQNSSDHASRSKLRTPMATRHKALSADRASRLDTIHSDPQSPPVALMRWPRPGETILSTSGTPVVSQVMPDKCANVNIPVKNGMLSLRPKKLNELNANIVDFIDPETMEQIKTLQQNLNVIMKMADRAGTAHGRKE